MITTFSSALRRLAPALAFMTVVSPLLAQDRPDEAIFRDLPDGSAKGSLSWWETGAASC